MKLERLCEKEIETGTTRVISVTPDRLRDLANTLDAAYRRREESDRSIITIVAPGIAFLYSGEQVETKQS